jgi:aquaporin Z
MNCFVKYLVEFVGTFIFLSVILTTGEAIPIGIALATAIFFGGKVSGGNFNPAVSIMMYLKGTLKGADLPMYIVAQVLGGIAALCMYKKMK